MIHRYYLLIVTSFLANIFFVFANVLADSWTTEYVSNSSSLYKNAIAIDSKGNPHIAYAAGRIWYAYNDNDNWYNEEVYSSGAGVSMRLDSSGKAHISFYDTTNKALNYATNVSGRWVITTVDRNLSTDDTSIALDKTDKAHISYYDVTNGLLKYASNTSGSWEIKTVDGYGGKFASIAVDSSGNAHICYYTGYLKYATNASGSWTSAVIEDTDVEENTAIAIDSSDIVHIVYHQSPESAGEDKLRYMNNLFGSWAITTLECNTSPDVGVAPSLAIDTDGKIHISYYNRIQYTQFGNLQYATNKNGCWETTSVKGETTYGDWTSIAVDSSGKVHIIYNDINGLKHAASE